MQKKYTFSDRFDLVYQAWLQTGKVPNWTDCRIREEDKDEINSGKMSPRVADFVARVQEDRKKLLRSPLIASKQVRLVSDYFSIDDVVYDFLSQHPLDEQKCSYVLTQDVCDLICTANVSVPDISLNEYFPFPGLYECKDGVLFGEVSAFFISNIKYRYAYHTSNPTLSTKDFAELDMDDNVVEVYAYKRVNGEYAEIRPSEQYKPLQIDGEHAYNQAVAFAQKLHLVQSAMRSPIHKNKERPNLDNVPTSTRQPTDKLYKYTVNLTKEYQEKMSKAKAQRGALSKDDKVLAPVFVSGYVRSQHFGKGNAETKTIWIDGFTRDQWLVQGKQTKVI